MFGSTRTCFAHYRKRLVHFTSQSHRQVFQIAMLGRRNDFRTPGSTRSKMFGRDHVAHKHAQQLPDWLTVFRAVSFDTCIAS